MKQLKVWKYSQNKITSRDEASLSKYLNDIGKIDLLSPEEEVVLAQRIHKWDSKALDALVNANLRFVVSVAKEYQNKWLTLWELINEWNIWLKKAAERFDETRWFKFISYAVWWIRQSILSALQEVRFIKLSYNQLKNLNRINKFREQYITEFYCYPDGRTISEELWLPEKEIVLLLSAQWKSSLDEKLGDESDANDFYSITPNHSEPEPDEYIVNETQKQQLYDLLNGILTEQEVNVIKLKLWLINSIWSGYKDIWDDYWLTTERVRQIYTKAIEKLKSRKDLFHALVSWDLRNIQIPVLKTRKKMKSNDSWVWEMQRNKLSNESIELRDYQIEWLENTYKAFIDWVNWKQVSDQKQEIDAAKLWRASMWSGKWIMAWKFIEEYIFNNRKEISALWLDISHLRILRVSHDTWVVNRGHEALFEWDENTLPVFSQEFQKRGTAHVLHTHSGNKRNIENYGQWEYSIIYTTIHSLKSNKHFQEWSQEYLLEQPPHLIIYDEWQSLQWPTYGSEIKKRMQQHRHSSWHSPFLLVMTWTPTKSTLKMVWDPILYRSLADHIQSTYCPPLEYYFIQSFEWQNFNQKLLEVKEKINGEKNNFKKRTILKQLKKEISDVVPIFPDHEIFVFDMLMRMQKRFEMEWKIQWTFIYCKNIAIAKKISHLINNQIKEHHFFWWEKYISEAFYHWSGLWPLERFKKEEVKFLVVINKLNLWQHIPSASNMVFYHDIRSDTIPEQRFARTLAQKNTARYLDYRWVIYRMMNILWLQEWEETSNTWLKWKEMWKEKYCWTPKKVQVFDQWLLCFWSAYTPYSEEKMNITQVVREIIWLETNIEIPKPSKQQIVQDYKEWLFSVHDLSIKNWSKRALLLNELYKNKERKYPNHPMWIKVPLWWNHDDPNTIKFIQSLLDGTEYIVPKPMITWEQTKIHFHKWTFDDALKRMKAIQKDKKFTVPRDWIAERYEKIAHNINTSEAYDFQVPLDLTALIRLCAWKNASSLKHLYQYVYDIWIDLTPFAITQEQYRTVFDSYLIEYCNTVQSNQWNYSLSDAIEIVISYDHYSQFTERFNQHYAQKEWFKMRETLLSLSYTIWKEHKTEEIKKWILWVEETYSWSEIIADYKNWILNVSEMKNPKYYLLYLESRAAFFQKLWIKKYFPRSKTDLVRKIAEVYRIELDDDLINKCLYATSHLKALFEWKVLELQKPKATKEDYTMLIDTWILTKEIILWGRTMRENRAKALNKNNKYQFDVHEYNISATSTVSGFSRNKIRVKGERKSAEDLLVFWKDIL
jgi:RNA polymerase primary sigma factor